MSLGESTLDIAIFRKDSNARKFEHVVRNTEVEGIEDKRSRGYVVLGRVIIGADLLEVEMWRN